MNGYRYEMKYIINKETADLLKKQLSLVMKLDPHSISQEYSYDIRSLYFDDRDSSAFYEKVDGVEFRYKYRIRIYNNSDASIKLECKHKDADMTYKEDCTISKKVTNAIIAGKYSAIHTERPFLSKFLLEARLKKIKPSVIVDYRRTAFTYPVSEVRITFDENIRSGRYDHNLFGDVNTLSAVDGIVMEVKFNDFLPEHINVIINSSVKEREAVSKFAYCRSLQ